MSKTARTKRLEELLAAHFKPNNDFYVFECTLGWAGKEIVDCVMYNCQREVYCFEIKQSVSDFHSKAALSFFGNKNYFVMPLDLYEKVKNEIPKDIGVYVAIDHLEDEERMTPQGWRQTFAVPVAGEKYLWCIKHARSRMLRADKEIILSSMLRCALSDRVSNNIGSSDEQLAFDYMERTKSEQVD